MTSFHKNKKCKEGWGSGSGSGNREFRDAGAASVSSRTSPSRTHRSVQGEGAAANPALGIFQFNGSGSAKGERMGGVRDGLVFLF